MGSARAFGAAAAAALVVASPVAAAEQVVVKPSGRPSAAIAAVEDAGGRVQVTSDGLVQALVPEKSLGALAADPAVADLSRPTVAFPDAVISRGVARIGADAVHAGGDRGAGVKIAVLDMAFGTLSRLDALAGTELPPLSRQQRLSFDATYGLAGRNYGDSASRHGELVAEIVYDVAPDAYYTFVNYHTALEFGLAVEYLVDVVKPDVIVHSNSFLAGPFDGTGWFARHVDRAAAAGILWVNSAGNYRRRHWEGKWTDANADGALDVPGHGDAFPLALSAAGRPACAVSWARPDPSGASGYRLGLFHDAAGEQPALDARSGRPIASTFVPEPEPHADLAPAFLVAGGTYYLRLEREGDPATDHVTLFCRFDLPEGTAVSSSSSPTPGDARGALSVGAFDAETLEFQPYSTEGPTDDGRLKPDVSAPTNVATTGQYLAGGTSSAAPHAAGAAALLWRQVAASAGTEPVAALVAARLRSLAREAGEPGADLLFGAGRVRLDLTAPALVRTVPRAGAAVAGTVPLRVHLLEAGTLEKGALALDGSRLAATVEGKVVTGAFDSRLLADGTHRIAVAAADSSGNEASFRFPLLVDNTAPSLVVAARRDALAGAPYRVRVAAADVGSGLGRAASIDFGDGARASGESAVHRYSRAGVRRVVVEARDRAGNETRFERRVRIAELRVSAAPDGGAVVVRVGRRNLVSVAVFAGSARVRTVTRDLGAGVHAIPLAGLASGAYGIVAEARGFRARAVLEVP